MADRYYGHQRLDDSIFFKYGSFDLQASSLSSSDLAAGYAAGQLDDGNRLALHSFNSSSQSYSMNATGIPLRKIGIGSNYGLHSGVPQTLPNYGSNYNRNRFAPYYVRGTFSAASNSSSFQPQQQQLQPYMPPLNNYAAGSAQTSYAPLDRCDGSTTTSGSGNGPSPYSGGTESGNSGQPVTLQFSNLDYPLDENRLRHFLLNQLKPITPVLSLVFEGNSYAKVTVPDDYFAKQVVTSLHRKKVGHKRMAVSYIRDSSLTEINTLRCQVAGLLKDVPYFTLPMYKFRELFQSRFKTSIIVLDLYKMQDICSIKTDENGEKYISLHPDLVNSIETSPLMECLQHSVPYCTIHFKREQHKGWAEQEIEPLPNVFMTVAEIKSIIYPLLKIHTGDIPVASLVHCISSELGTSIVANENGVNLEHLICCVHGIQITTNIFGIKILGWLEPEYAIGKDANDGRFHLKCGTTSDPLYQISREVIELVKMSPKSTMKFSRFIPAYHNHFGKQCRVADYGYTKLIELFEALSTVVQIMGDGENRQITLQHRTQVRRFTSDLLRILRSQGNKSVLLSQLSSIFSQTQNRKFDVTDYGVCDINDILDGLVNSNTVVISRIQNGNDILISIPKRKQTAVEIEKTAVFAGEVVELLRNAPQYSVLFQKFVRSYHYHFGYQCRLSDYGYLKLADLMEAIRGVVKIGLTNDEDKRIQLSVNVAQRVFAEQLEELVRDFSGSVKTSMKLDQVLEMHKKKYGYQIQSQTLGFDDIVDAVKVLPYIELLKIDDIFWISCHYDDPVFRIRCYRACKIVHDFGKDAMALSEFTAAFAAIYNEVLTEQQIEEMKHAVKITTNKEDQRQVSLTSLMKFIMSIIRILEQRYMTVSEIATVMNLGISDCFEYGYANLYSLLRAYPDIFVVEIGASQERSEISLVAQSDLASHISFNSSNRSRIPSAINSNENSLSPSERLLNALIPTTTTTEKSKFMNCIAALASQANPKRGAEGGGSNSRMNTSFAGSISNKENSYNSTFNGSLNSSINSDPNTSAGSNGYCSGGGNGSFGLWNRRQHSNYLRDNNDIYNITNVAPLVPCYVPPKPDTPPSDLVPFWVDPIWANSNGEKAPVDSLNIHLPEFNSLNILPMIMSPYTLSKIENMKNMFSFDNTDRTLS